MREPSKSKKPVVMLFNISTKPESCPDHLVSDLSAALPEPSLAHELGLNFNRSQFFRRKNMIFRNRLVLGDGPFGTMQTRQDDFYVSHLGFAIHVFWGRIRTSNAARLQVLHKENCLALALTKKQNNNGVRNTYLTGDVEKVLEARVL